MVESWWNDVPHRFRVTRMTTFVVMPNHIHGIVVIEPSEELLRRSQDETGQTRRSAPTSRAAFRGADRRVCPVPTPVVSTLQTHAAPSSNGSSTITSTDYLGTRVSDDADAAPYRQSTWAYRIVTYDATTSSDASTVIVDRDARAYTTADHRAATGSQDHRTPIARAAGDRCTESATDVNRIFGWRSRLGWYETQTLG